MMEADKKNILVIENQQYEFTLIIEFLKNFNVYPSKDCFEKFINNVHVALNKEYDNEYRKSALNNIENIVNGVGDPFNNKKPVELILMDHILGGAHYCHTGIDLANYLNSARNDNAIPVVFLSRTPQEGKAKLEGINLGSDSYNLLTSSNRMGYEQGYKNKYVNSCDWVHKGYFGDDCLDETYFNKYVIKAVTDVLPLSEKKNLLCALNHILEHYPFTKNEKTRKTKLEHIKACISSGRSYRDEFKDYIFDLRRKFNVISSYVQMTNMDINIINMQYDYFSAQK